MRYLLDTTIVSSPVSAKPSRKIIETLERQGHECAMASPVWHELIYGCRRLAAGKRRTALEIYLFEVLQPSFPILPYDDAAAEWHGRERARLEKLGRPAPYVDAQIAAIAHVNGLILVTMNTKDFARYKDLAVENWGAL